MKKIFILLILSFFSVQGLAGSCPDGSEPVKSVSADGSYFVFNCGGSNTANSSASSQKVAKALAGIDIENDPNIDFFKPPETPYPTGTLYFFGYKWQMADFNKDGYSDVLYIGAMIPNNIDSVGVDTSGACGGGVCKGNKPLPSLFLGDAKHNLTYAPELIIDKREDSGMSSGYRALVADYNNDDILDFYVADTGLGTHNGVRDSYFLSQPNGTWLESSKTHLSHSNFVVFDHGGATGDIDNDGDMDVVITDNTCSNCVTALWCLINDGTGFLNKRICGGSPALGLELADMDGDGDLDAIVGAHEYGKYGSRLTGIVWNNGKGDFPSYNTTPFKQYKNKWGTIPEVSAADLDNDGDLDVVYSRAGELYVGTALQIIENLGNKKFKDHGIFPLVEAPDDFIPTHEGNEWNDFIEDIRFRDLDKDGDIDLYLSGSMSRKTDSMVLLNQGNFSFELLRPSLAKVYVVSEFEVQREEKKKAEKLSADQRRKEKNDAMKAELAADVARIKAEIAAEIEAEKAKSIAEESAKALVEAAKAAVDELIEKELAELEAELLEEAKVKRITEEKQEQKMLDELAVQREAEHPFSKALSSLNETVFEGEKGFNAFTSPVVLNSKVQILGYKNLKTGSKSVMARLHLQFWGNNVSTNVCIFWHQKNKFMGVKLSFLKNDWGGIKGITKFGTNTCEGVSGFIGHWEVGDNSNALTKLGIKAILIEIQKNTRQLLEALDEQTDVSLSFLTSKEFH